MAAEGTEAVLKNGNNGNGNGDPLIVFMPSGRRGRFPLGTPVLEAAGLGPHAPAMAGASLMGAFLLWGYGIWWLGVAVLVTVRHLREGLSFDLGWWGYTFPLGVFALATLKLAGIFPVHALDIFAAGLVMVLTTIWLVVAGKTIRGAWNGRLFNDPCLNDAG